MGRQSHRPVGLDDSIADPLHRGSHAGGHILKSTSPIKTTTFAANATKGNNNDPNSRQLFTQVQCSFTAKLNRTSHFEVVAHPCVMSMRRVPAGHLVRGVFMVATTLMLCSQHAEGLRGCSSFGHSCFGAHGKRTDGGEDLAPSSVPELTDLRYPLNPRYDVNVHDSRDYGPINMNVPSASGKRIPLALLKILRNLANEMDDQSSSDKK